MCDNGTIRIVFIKMINTCTIRISRRRETSGMRRKDKGVGGLQGYINHIIYNIVH